jgi:hypothetical protein
MDLNSFATAMLWWLSARMAVAAVGLGVGAGTLKWRAEAAAVLCVEGVVVIVGVRAGAWWW